MIIYSLKGKGMGTDYRKIEFAAGESIETVVAELLKHNRQGELVCGCFNGHMLYSDKVTLDNVYLAVLGKSKAEYDKEKTEWIMREERKRKSMKHIFRSWRSIGRKEGIRFWRRSIGLSGIAVYPYNYEVYMKGF